MRCSRPVEEPRKHYSTPDEKDKELDNGYPLQLVLRTKALTDEVKIRYKNTSLLLLTRVKLNMVLIFKRTFQAAFSDSNGSTVQEGNGMWKSSRIREDLVKWIPLDNNHRKLVVSKHIAAPMNNQLLKLSCLIFTSCTIH
ncbi:hypothetical protein J6590_036671 [Homalodisca vitripennis]|nr:hypothetical protein J6590_036671 [Homalodisca vitripennis]